jgi:mersacidin/lichenicidin family type 2 lantibiotic
MKLDLIRAWKDEAYREGLTAQQLALLPANPAGAIELAEHELSGVHGAMLPLSITILSVVTCCLTSRLVCS